MSYVQHKMRLCACGSPGLQQAVRRLPVSPCANHRRYPSDLFSRKRGVALLRCGGNDLKIADDGAVGAEPEEVTEEVYESENPNTEEGEAAGFSQEELEREATTSEVAETVAEASEEVAVGIAGGESDQVAEGGEEAVVSKGGTEEEGGKPALPADCPFEVGQVVVGKVKWTKEFGAKVIIEDSEYEGWCPRKLYPYRIMQKNHPGVDIQMHSGLRREFSILTVPEDMDLQKGPILSARHMDRKTAYRRLEQIMAVCNEDREVILSKCIGVNAGGVRCITCGLSSFLPRSHCHHQLPGFVEQPELEAHYEGRDIPVTVIAIEPQRNRIVVSEKNAAESNVLRNIRPGALVWGTVRTMREWGAFVSIDNSRLSFLLHISNVSQVNVRDLEDVFQIGDRVCAVVISMEPDFQRVSLSTADLEETPGDMLVDKAKVYEHAPKAVEQIQKEIDAQQAEYQDEA